MNKEALGDAKAKARRNGCFVVDRAGEYLLYREVVPKNQYIGKSTTTEGICRLVKKSCPKP